MSQTYRVRFDTTDMNLRNAIDRLHRVLLSSGILYEGRVVPMISQRGWPTVDTSDCRALGIDIDRIADVIDAAKDWWGASLSCFSVPLANQLGPGEWVEVDFILFSGPLGQLSLTYIESGAAHRCRLEDDRSAQELYELQLDLCNALGFQLSVYDRVDLNLSPTVSLGEVHQRIERAAEGLMGSSIAVSQARMDFSEARRLAGRNSMILRQSTSGYTLFPFLRRDRPTPHCRIDRARIRT